MTFWPRTFLIREPNLFVYLVFRVSLSVQVQVLWNVILRLSGLGQQFDVGVIGVNLEPGTRLGGSLRGLRGFIWWFRNSKGYEKRIYSVLNLVLLCDWSGIFLFGTFFEILHCARFGIEEFEFGIFFEILHCTTLGPNSSQILGKGFLLLLLLQCTESDFFVPIFSTKMKKIPTLRSFITLNISWKVAQAGCNSFFLQLCTENQEEMLKNAPFPYSLRN